MLVKASMSDRIRSLLLDRIVGGSYKPGDKLLEIPLSEEFGTSVAPVREALRGLEAMRVVQCLPYKGTRVKEFSAKDIHDAYQIRAVLEQFAASNQCSLETTVKVLKEIQTKIAQTIDQKSFANYVSLNFDFHRVIVEAAASQLLSELWNVAMIWSSIRLELLTKEPESIEQVTKEVTQGYSDHQQIVTLLEDGKLIEAGALLKQHAELFSPRL
jgi:DNA-binding GntR family transcriptional regulator